MRFAFSINIEVLDKNNVNALFHIYVPSFNLAQVIYIILGLITIIHMLYSLILCN